MASQIDYSELRRWENALRAAGRDVHDEAPKVVAKGSLNIKEDARRRAPRTPHTPAYYASITYDLTTEPGVTEGEIGPVEGRAQRGLGNLLEYGGPHNAPRPHLEPALDAEEPRFYAACADLAELLPVRAWQR